MSRSKQLRIVVLLLFGLAAVGGKALGQEPQEQPPAQEPPLPDNTKPKPAGRGVPGLLGDQGDQDTTDTWQPDTLPVTGLISPTLGTPPLRHSYWAPGAQYGLTIQKNPYGGTNSDWYTTQFIGGTFSLVKAWSRSLLDVNYSGGGVLTSVPGQGGNGWYQQLGAGQSFQFRRWQWQWIDQFAYLPESQFGFGVGTGLSVPGIGGSLGLSTGGTSLQNQDIYSAVGPRYSNTVVAQGTYAVTPRSSFTMAGMDGLLRFTQSQNADSDNYLGSFGYNYQLTKADSFGVMYRFSAYHFPSEPQGFSDSLVSVTYGRKVTRRVAFNGFVGPGFISSRFPVGTGSGKSQTTVQGNASLSYGFKKGSINAAYLHGPGAGSGVLFGSKMDQFSFGGSRQIGRLWGANANVGYSRNRALTSSATLGFPGYDTVFVGGGIGRPLSRTVDFNLSYTAYIERTNGVCATGTNCGANTTQHTITVFLNWHARPFVIE